MARLTTKAAFPLIVGALVALTAAAPAQNADPLDELFARGRAAQAATKTITAAFTETSVSSLLKDPQVATGTLVAAMPIRVVMRYTSPVAKTVALDDKRLVVAWPAEQRREEIDIAATQRRVQKYFVDASPRQLREQFDITVAADMKDAAYRLDLAPRRKQIAEGLARLRIWVDRTHLAMIKMTLDFPGGDSKTLELRDVRTNVGIDESAFAVLARKR
jgi:outer membrane lipoprotein-sorting protein